MPGPGRLHHIALDGALRDALAGRAQPVPAEPAVLAAAMRPGLAAVVLGTAVPGVADDGAPAAGPPGLGRPRAVLVRPELLQLHAVLQPDDGQPREALAVPVCPTTPVTDLVLFEDPRDPSLRMHLPRYRVRERDGRPMVRFTTSGDGHELQIEVAAYAPPELGDVSATGPVPHDLQLVLRFESAGQLVERPCTVEPTPEGHRLGRLPLSAADLSLVVSALQEPSMRPALVVRRVLTVAVPVPGQAPRPLRHIRIRQLPPLVLPAEVAGSDDAPVPAGPPRYRAETVALDHDERALFVFPPGLAVNADVYADVAATPRSAGLVPVSVAHEGRLHRYWREGEDVFRYLPDSFKLARQAHPPHAPTLMLRFLPGATGLDDVRVQLDYVFVPAVDPGRLADAAAQLPALLGEGDLRPRFSVLTVARDKAVLHLSVPGAATGPRAAAQVVLATAISERLELPLPAFQELWEALFSTTPVLFQGSLEVTLADQVEAVPVVGRLDDLVGLPLECRERFGDDGTLTVTITNRGESPVAASAMTATVLTTSGEVPARPADPAARIDLAPGAATDVVFVPQAPLEAATDVLVSFEGLTSELDREALYEAVLDRTGPLDVDRAVRVRARHLFAAPSDDPLVAVLVDFERGTTLELTPEAPDGEGLVRMPLADVVLGRTDSADLASAAFRYRVRLVRQRSQVEGPWVQATAEPVYAAVPEPAAAPT